jgi:spermidine synthase
VSVQQPAGVSLPRLSLSFYLTVGLIAGAVIAYQIAIMRLFAVASWAHFGSFVVGLAMFAFGLVSAIMCVGKDTYHRHWDAWIRGALLVFGPLMVAANCIAQLIPFNPIFLVSDPMQKWHLVGNFLLYFLPFVPGAFFLGLVFLRGQAVFGKVYFADLGGSGLCGLILLGSMYLVLPEHLILVPLCMWLAAALIWFLSTRQMLAAGAVVALALAAVVATFTLPQLTVLPYKGVSYARNFPDSERIFKAKSPHGFMEVYSSSYFHFAPGQSDMAALNLAELPENAYYGMFIDSDGPAGIMKPIPERLTAYFRFLPMYYPFVLKKQPDVFVVQLGGGISTNVALRSGAGKVTVAEGNPMVLGALRDDPEMAKRTGNLLSDQRVKVIPYDGRLYVTEGREKFDVVDLSLADSTGLSSAGGFAITEKYSYTREAFAAYMRALKPGGIVSVTVWNKEEPSKSVLRLFATMVEAARMVDGQDIASRFYVVQSYLSTVTVLYKQGGFTPADVEALNKHTAAMAFDQVYYPGMPYDPAEAKDVLQGYHDQFFVNQAAIKASGFTDPSSPGSDASSPAAGSDDSAGPKDGDTEPTSPDNASSGGNAPPTFVPATKLARLAMHSLITGEFKSFADAYVFRTEPLTNDRPYFAAYIKFADLTNFIDKLELVQDEWGYLLLWATLGVGVIAALIRVLFPMVFGWRSIFARQPGKLGVIVYFMCLGLGYIVVEIGLIAKFMLALTNATVSASVLITGMLVFSGLGSLYSTRFIDRCRRIMPFVFVAIAALLLSYGFLLDPLLDAIGAWPYLLRILACLALLFPASFLMGFCMPTGMTMLSRLGKEHLFLWAWGINGSFSVIGSVLVPLIATQFGLAALLILAAGAYLLALPAFFAVLLPKPAGLPA